MHNASNTLSILLFLHYLKEFSSNAPCKEVVDGLIISHKAGLGIKRDELEAFALAGGNIKNVTFGMIAAQKAGIELTFKKACNADFNGKCIKYIKHTFVSTLFKRIFV